jgi:zinc/manganese transport system substrate-binding protein
MKRVGMVLLILLGMLNAQIFAASSKKLHIVTSFLPEYCFAANVAGDAALVENLLPGNVSLHDYQLSPGDLRKLSSADLIVVNGLGMENFLKRALETLGPGIARKVVTLSDGLSQELIPASSNTALRKRDRETAFDPHIWLDPRLAIHCVTNLNSALRKADPANASTYALNASKYVARLQALDAELARDLQPVKGVAFITYHRAFSYFARRYDLSLAGIVEQTPEMSPSAREMQTLLNIIRDKKVKALFTEPSSSPRLAAQIARDTGIRTAELDPLEVGTLEPLAYESGLRRNCKTLLNTLR